jgi:hypothetical protein
MSSLPSQINIITQSKQTQAIDPFEKEQKRPRWMLDVVHGHDFGDRLGDTGD